MVVRWQFYDPTVPETYTVAINPNEGGSRSRKKAIGYVNTSGPDGITIAFEGRDEPERITFSGVILTQAHHDAFHTWFDKRRQICITDDLSRQMWVYIESFDPRRVLSVNYPWKHSYTCSAFILDWV